MTEPLAAFQDFADHIGAAGVYQQHAARMEQTEEEGIISGHNP